MSHVSLLNAASQARSLLLVLVVVSVLGLVQGDAGPLAAERAVEAHSAALTEDNQSLFLPQVSRKGETLPRFQPVASPNFASEVASLDAVDLLNDHDGWAVGSYDRRQASLILRWDGVNWTPVPSPNFDDTRAHTVKDVVAITPNDAWAIVDRDPASMLHWDGQVWRVVTSEIDPTTDTLSALAASGPNDVWAIGSVVLLYPTPQTQILILHWDGTRWSRVAIPNQDVNFSVLYAVSARAPNDVWAVGYGHCDLENPNCPNILHWDGVAWNAALPGARQDRVYTFQGVAALAANDVWVVGFYYAEPDNIFVPISFHWNGTAWTKIAVPAPNVTDAYLTQVAALAPNNVLALGGLRTGTGAYSPWLVRWNGTAWTTVTDMPGLTSERSLVDFDVASPATVVAVGAQPADDDPETSAQRPWSLHWDGSAWRESSTPSLMLPRNWLNGVAAVSPTDVWAVGNYEDVAALYSPALLLHWNGQRWTPFDLPHFDPSNTMMMSVAAVSSTDVWAVGGLDNHEEPLIIHWDGVRWERASLPPLEGWLNAVAARTTDDVWAVGHDYWADPYRRPVVLHWDGRLWSSRPAPALDGNADLYDVEPIARDDVWTVGYTVDPANHLDRPLTLHWDGGQWTHFPTPNLEPAAAALSCVTALAPNNAWAMGWLERDGTSEPLVLRWNGAAWTEGPRPALQAAHAELQDCLALSPTEVYAVGWLQAQANGPTESLTLRWDGTQWTRLASANPGAQTSRLSALSAVADSLWTVGYSAEPGWPRRARETLIQRAYGGGYPTR